MQQGETTCSGIGYSFLMKFAPRQREMGYNVPGNGVREMYWKLKCMFCMNLKL